MLFDAGPDPDLAGDLAFFDLPPLQPDTDPPGIWAENLPALEAFLAVASQWRRISLSMGGVYAEGLDYAGVEAGLRLAGITLTPEDWRDLRLIEAGATHAQNED